MSEVLMSKLITESTNTTHLRQEQDFLLDYCRTKTADFATYYRNSHGATRIWNVK